MADEEYDWNLDIKIIANSKTSADHKAMLDQVLEGLQALKDANLINYADWTVHQKFKSREGKVG